ncbi:TRAFAC class myosin-kinesin ATPase superfamily [Ranunculus cassubicifolius]
MKHFMLPRMGVLRENLTETTPQSSSPNPNNKPRSGSRKHKLSKENAPPSDPNLLHEPSSVSPSMAIKPPLSAGKSRPPRPPSSSIHNPLKRKLNMDNTSETSGITCVSDTGVKVLVRMRPPNKNEEEEEMIVQKVTGDSLTILGQTFTFDSVSDTNSTQQEIFKVVGAPLVDNCLAGFNSSIFAYGQTGSGKTYTMWGPANALLEGNLANSQQGLTPRVFEQLFARIEEEQVRNADKQLQYQCRCSFLEIYNEQITDLLDPTQRSLQIREDVKSGVYVENLTEELVRSMDDVTKILVKGFSNRKTGATSLNAESSRSHSVFTCVVESRCKSASDGLSSIRVSRINLVDLAGSERQKLTGTAGERLKEAGNINRSLSQLGNLINILAEVSQTGKQRHIPYRDSRLTFLLQESLGGNAKLAMICAISPAQSCKSETFSTLRFAQRAKTIKNKAVVNEVTQDDVNVLREVIRQLKDELLRMKENGNQPSSNGGYATSWNARRSLSLLKMSLNRPTTLAHVEEDSDEEMEIDEEAVEKLCAQVGQQLDYVTEGSQNTYNVVARSRDEAVVRTIQPNDSSKVSCSSEIVLEKSDVNMEDSQLAMASEEIEPNCSHQKSDVGDNSSESVSGGLEIVPVTSLPDNSLTTTSANSVLPSELSIISTDVPPVLKSPTPSVSPKVNISRKSLKTLSMTSASQKNPRTENCLEEEAICLSFARAVEGRSSKGFSPRTSMGCHTSTEHLADSLHRGLQIIDSHRQSSALRRSSFRFPYKPTELKSILSVEKVDVGVQTISPELGESAQLCSECKSRIIITEPKEVKENSEMQLLEDLTMQSNEELGMQLVNTVPKEVTDNTEMQLLEDSTPQLNEDSTTQPNEYSGMQLVPTDGSPPSSGRSKNHVPKAVEKVLAGAIRREMALEDFCSKQTAEIAQLNRLIQQYKHERECNAIIEQTREDKIMRLESLMDGVLPTEEFMEEELFSLTNEHKILKAQYDNHPEVLRTKIELKRVQDELDSYRNFFDMGERDVLIEEIQHLRSQLKYYVENNSSASSPLRRSSLLKLTYTTSTPTPTPSPPTPLCTIPESVEESAEDKFEQERLRWEEVESKWISLSEELRAELEETRGIVQKQKVELDSEKRCSEELKEAIQMAMQGHARILEQYADLQEKHITLHARHRKMQEGVEDVKKAAAKAGVKGAESKFINALATEISALRVEREKEKRYLMDENKGLQAQLRDTAEAVQAAGELLVRLKEAEEAATVAQTRAMVAEQEAVKAYKQVDSLKKKHEKEINNLNQVLAPKYDVTVGVNGGGDEKWREEFEAFRGEEDDGEMSKIKGPSSWFSDYDRCNM